MASPTESQNQSMTAKPKRRLLRFSLRAMLLVLTVFGVWLGVKVNRANNQRAVVAWLTENGGWVMYDWWFDKDGKRIDMKIVSGNTDTGHIFHFKLDKDGEHIFKEGGGELEMETTTFELPIVFKGFHKSGQVVGSRRELSAEEIKRIVDMELKED